MTKEALAKLNEKQMQYCLSMSAIIDIDRKAGAIEQYEKDTGKLRGFLECLTQMEIINPNELKALYLWFFTADRNNLNRYRPEN